MVFKIITAWEEAYDNRRAFPNFDRIPAAWAEAAATFRTTVGERRETIAYGDHPRHTIELTIPDRKARGLVVFLHGGWWRSFDAHHFSHLAGGALAQGHAVAMPNYRLAPEATIPEITADAAAAVACAAERVAGPIVLAGHSAGGHLVCRLASRGSPLADAVAARVEHVVTISGVHDLRPLVGLAANDAYFRLDDATAEAESPALARPRDGIRATVWVGAAEKPEFLRQSALLANAWYGLGAAVRHVEEPGRHHFDVIDSLAAPDGALARALFAREGS